MLPSAAKTIHQLFEEQAERSPDAVAYYFEPGPLSYRELNERSNRLASYLRRAGIRPNVPVGICLERSAEMVVSLLAVLKAGGAYVPLEPTAPTQRLREILQDTEPPLLLLHSHLDPFAEYDGRKVFLDRISAELLGEPAANLPYLTTPDDLFNIIYTSGSTGRPKGVLIPIRAVLNRLFWMWADFPFCKSDVMLFHKSYALIAATWECFGGLLKGVPTVVVTREEVLDRTVLLSKLTRYGISYLHATPSLLQSLLEQVYQASDQWTSLRLATTSAETMPPSLARSWCRRFPGTPLLNLYGSTECSSNVTVYDAQNLPSDASSVPIGKPFANNQVHILDDQMQPVAAGEVGEMCVSGACLALGYHGLPDLTRERFIENTSIGKEADQAKDSNTGWQARLFRTGDLARTIGDGSIQLVGRKDNQVKIRGFRIELEGVEAALVEHEAVERCVVALRRDPAIGDCLSAYVVLNNDTTALALRRFLQERLLDYMIPAHFTRLQTLPLTSAGKVDRQKLPPPDESWSKNESGTTAPRTELEAAVHQIVQAAVQKSEFGIDEYFLDLGLHSLLMIQVQGRLAQLLGRDVPITAILQYGTVRSLARHLATSARSTAEPLAQGRSRAEKRRRMRRQRHVMR